MSRGLSDRRPVRVLIADDDDGVRTALNDVLAADPRFRVAGVTAHGAELPRLVAAAAPDLVLLDVRMPSGGADAVALVRSASPPAPNGHGPCVVAISADTSAASVVAMLRAGVVGYLAKGQIGADLPDLLARCADGEVVLAVASGADALRTALRGTR